MYLQYFLLQYFFTYDYKKLKSTNPYILLKYNYFSIFLFDLYYIIINIIGICINLKGM